MLYPDVFTLSFVQPNFVKDFNYVVGIMPEIEALQKSVSFLFGFNIYFCSFGIVQHFNNIVVKIKM